MPLVPPGISRKGSRDTSTGGMLRQWRLHRRHSQLTLALAVGVSARHLSFVENNRAHSSRSLLLRIAEKLAVPCRELNALLLSAGFAPEFSMRSIAHAAMSETRQAVRLLLRSLEPCPALAIDRHWTLVDSNRAADHFLGCVAPRLLQPPVNVLRLTFHPDGLAGKIANLEEWRSHLLRRLSREIDLTRDPALAELQRELQRAPRAGDTPPDNEHSAISVASPPVLTPLRLRTPNGEMSFFSTTTVFGSAVDATASELAVESFLPADRFTRQTLNRIAKQRRSR